MFAATSIDWSTVGTCTLHAVEILALALLFVGFVALIVFLIAKSTGAKPGAIVAKAEASPQAKEIEAAVGKAMESMWAKFAASPPVAISGHPVATQLADVIQKSKVAAEVVNKVGADLLSAQNSLAATPKQG